MTAVLADLLQQDPWMATATLALVAVVAALLAHRILGSLLRRATRGAPILNTVLANIERPAGAAMPLLALQLVWQVAPNTLHLIDNVRHVNGLLLIAAMTWLAMSAIRGVAMGVIARHPVDVEDNIQARRIQTQARVLARSAMIVVLIAGAAMALMTFPGARQVGASLLASAGVLGIVGGLAARPVFSNLIAGLQLALAQPLRLDDVLIINGEWGRVEEITGSYVVMRLWDERRLIVPLQWFIENPFQNWTRSSAQIHQSVILYVDFTTPLDVLRAEVRRVVEAAPEWDKRTAQLVVVDATEQSMKLRVLVSARAAGPAFDLGCKVREALFTLLARDHPHCLPNLRQINIDDPRGADQRAAARSDGSPGAATQLAQGPGGDGPRASQGRDPRADVRS
ncbi:MAG TPA: mechanosensitive ion channel domain-containing protein [Ramlibacter sp.]|jgi:small-conductance mechanosensitive channel|uniref:mechanosensitive ion channel family protein n=1 Tax=Ramlibacter sp. TaxID=1917967 RepID=UPI002D4A0B16|nr:mechanosensitive ion channel domain-containing protein [Ramlibacter sp.]HZY19608.1 mechanosensitive ion channel domain-containing protein [Ramlibacter sp.]